MPESKRYVTIYECHPDGRQALWKGMILNMLKLILGRKQSGKTYRCLEEAERAVKNGGQVMMLVPEQYSFECQRHLLFKLGPSVSNMIEIHSFTSLCEAIGSEFGGISGRAVDDGTRFLLLRQAVGNMRDSLKCYSEYTESDDFIKKLLPMISELKQARTDSDRLFALSESVESEAFSDKLYDIALIMSAYDALLENRFIEPLDLIGKTVARMRDNSFFAGKTVIIDEFKGFTEAQFELLDRIIAGSDSVYAFFCCDSLTPENDTDIFSNVKRSASRLTAIAKSHGIKVEDPDITEYSGASSEAIRAFESFIAEKDTGIYEKDAGDITICRVASVQEEADCVMTSIRKLVREKGYRYRDFVIISRNEDTYKQIIENAAAENEVPCFTDTKIPVSELPLSVFVLSAFRAAETLDSADILRALKTGLAGMDFSDINKLENYVFMWSITGVKWTSNWSMSPFGLEKCTENESEEYEKLRVKAVNPILMLREYQNGTAGDMCRAIMKLIDCCGTVDALKVYTKALESNGRENEAEYQRAGYDVFIKTLDKIEAVMGKETVTLHSFTEVLSSALSFETVGEIPQTKDQVVYGTADRIRPLRPKAVFVMGVNQDVFPAAILDNSLFSRNERETMIDSGINISDCSVKDCLDEKFLFYSAACSASEKVYLSYSKSCADGTSAEPAAVINAVGKAFPLCRRVSSGFDSGLTLDALEAVEPAFRKLAANFKSDSQISAALKSYFTEKEEYSSRLAAICNSVYDNEPSLSPESAGLLYGDELRLSASKMESFCNCHFMFFCRYGIGIEKRNKVDFDPLTRGNIVHYVLERFVNAHKDDIGMLDEDDIRNEVCALCDTYISEAGSDISVLDDKFGYMLSVLKETAALIVIALNNEFAQSEFRPRFCELKVGMGVPNEQYIDSIKVNAYNGGSISLIGSIDRVDTTPDGKVRVIDYKTGVKDFRLSGVLSGMNMQMLLYLYAAVKNGRDLLKAAHPAGILYFPARKNISDGERSEYIKMNGLVESDPDTVRQMEKEGKGQIVPAKLYPNGKTFYKSNSIVESEGFGHIFNFLDKALENIGNAILKGDITPSPLRSGDKLKCEYCDYKQICRFESEEKIRDEIKYSTPETVEIMRQEAESDGC